MSHRHDTAPAGGFAARRVSWRDRWDLWYRRALPTYWMALAMSTHLPKLDIRGTIAPSDKFLHLTAFGMLAFLFWRWCEALSRPLSRRFVFIAAPVLIIYAAIDESTQGPFGRSVDIDDWFYNVAGILSMLTILEISRRFRGAAVRTRR